MAIRKLNTKPAWQRRLEKEQKLMREYWAKNNIVPNNGDSLPDDPRPPINKKHFGKPKQEKKTLTQQKQEEAESRKMQRRRRENAVAGRDRRVKQRKEAQELRVARNVPHLGQDNAPEPSDTFNMTLFDCKTEADVATKFKADWKIFHNKTRKGMKRCEKLPADKKKVLSALLLKPAATSAPMLINPILCQEAYHFIFKGLKTAVADDPEIEMALVTFIAGDDLTSHTQTWLHLHRSQQRVIKTCRAITRDFIGVTEMALFNSHGHPDGGQNVQSHEHVLVWGPDIVAKAGEIAFKHRGRYPANFTGAEVINVKRVSLDDVNLARIASYLLKPPYKCMNWNPGKDGKPGHMNHSEKGDRDIRYLRLAQIRSMMSVEDVIFGAGQGLRIRSDLVKRLRSIADTDAGAGRVLHPDAISSFWVEVICALGLDWNLPVIMTKK